MVVSTYHQTHGKGYGESEWHTVENQNLTFSVLFSDDKVNQKDLPIFNMWIALCLNKILTNWHIESYIKWPNDIIIYQKKVGGILIQTKINQTKIKYIVVGIGLNVFQKEFNDIKSATSIQKEYLAFDKNLDDCLIEILNFIEYEYNHFIKNNFEQVVYEYHQHLFKKDKVASYMIQDKIVNGILRYIDKDGNANIEIEGLGLKTFKHKEIKLNY